MTAFGTAYGQNYTLPAEIFDRMYFEVVRGRLCDSVQVAQANELKALGLELIETTKALNLSQKALGASESEADHLRQALTASEEITRETAKKQRKKGRREGAIGVGIIAVVLLLL